MGTELTPSGYTFGNDCDACEGVSGLWADGETPKYITARFSGVLTDSAPSCSWFPFPNDQDFVLTQAVGSPCQWLGTFLINGYYCDILYRASYGGLSSLLFFYYGIEFFSGYGTGICEKSFANYHTSPGQCWYNGSVNLTWKSIPYSIASLLFSSLPPIIYFDEDPIDSDSESLYLASTEIPMNIQSIVEL